MFLSKKMAEQLEMTRTSTEWLCYGGEDDYGEVLETEGEKTDEEDVAISQLKATCGELPAGPPAFKPTYQSEAQFSDGDMRMCDFMMRRFNPNNRFFELTRLDPDAEEARVVFRLVDEAIVSLVPSDWRGMVGVVQREGEEEVDLEKLARLCLENLLTFRRSIEHLRTFVKGVSGCDDFAVISRYGEHAHLLLQAIHPINELASCYMKIKGEEAFAPLRIKESLCRDLAHYNAQKNSALHSTKPTVNKRMGDSLVSDW